MGLRNAKLITGHSGMLLISTLICGLASTSLQADTRTTDDYIALVFEAEDHASKDERWVLTEPSTPAQADDPDANHSDGAMGNAYLELLPDVRVDHDDDFGPPTAIWASPGAGPQASYPLTFPEAGRYYVHIRAYSTGSEDNGIHVGLNGNWPDSGARLQLCNGKHSWYWSSNQRDSGGAGSCGVEKTIWVTVEEAGEHTFMISAREDGFEIDRVMLIKDMSSNTRICSPDGADGIYCRDGVLENVDEVVDVAVILDSSDDDILIDGSYEFSADVVNYDRYDIADNTQLLLDIGSGEQWDISSIDAACELQEQGIVCDLGELHPTGPEDEHIFHFTLNPLQSGELSVSASMSTDSIDGYAANDTADLSTTVTDPGSLSQLNVVLNSGETSWVSGTESTVSMLINNVGTGDAEDVVASFSLPSGLSIASLPSACTGDTSFSCELGELAVGESTQLDFTLEPVDAGMFSTSVSVTASNIDGADVTDTLILIAIEAVTEPVDEPDTDEPKTEEPVTQAPVDDSSGAFSVWFVLVLTTLLFFRAFRHVPFRRPAPCHSHLSM